MGGRPACCRLTYLLGGEKHALGLSRIQGLVGILRLRAVHAWLENDSNLSPTAQWVNAGLAFWEQAVDGSRLSAVLAHTR